MAWDDIEESTIFNCWKHVKILPTASTGTIASADIPMSSPATSTARDYGNIFERMAEACNIPAEWLMTPEEFESVDSAIVTGEDLTDEEIVELARTDTTDGDDDADDDVEVPHPPSSIEAKAAINLMFRYLEAHSSSTDSGLKAACRLQFEIDSFCGNHEANFHDRLLQTIIISLGLC